MSSRSRMSLTVERTFSRSSSGERSAAFGAISASTLAWTFCLDCFHASSRAVRSDARRMGCAFAPGAGAAPLPAAPPLDDGRCPVVRRAAVPRRERLLWRRRRAGGAVPSAAASFSDRFISIRPSRARAPCWCDPSSSARTRAAPRSRRCSSPYRGSGVTSSDRNCCMPPASFLPISELAAETSAGFPLLIDFMTSREYGRTDTILLSRTSWTSLMSIPMSSSTLLSTTPMVWLLMRSFSSVRQEHPHVADARQVQRHHAQDPGRVVERRQHDLGQLGRRVDDDVVEVAAQGAHHLVDVLRGDHVGVGRAEGRGEHGEAELVLLEVLLDVLVEIVLVHRLPGQQVRDREPWPQVQRGGDLAELQVEIDQADALARLGGQVAGQVGGIEGLATTPAGRRHREDLGELRPFDDDAVGDHGKRRIAARRRDVGDVEGALEGGGQLPLAGRVLDQFDGTGADDVAQVGLGLRARAPARRRGPLRPPAGRPAGPCRRGCRRRARRPARRRGPARCTSSTTSITLALVTTS